MGIHPSHPRLLDAAAGPVWPGDPAPTTMSMMLAAADLGIGTAHAAWLTRSCATPAGLGICDLTVNSRPYSAARPKRSGSGCRRGGCNDRRASPASGRSPQPGNRPASGSSYACWPTVGATGASPTSVCCHCRRSAPGCRTSWSSWACIPSWKSSRSRSTTAWWRPSGSIVSKF
jgi:hypothetical protein